MNGAITLGPEMVGSIAEGRSSAIRRGLTLAGVVLAATVGLAAGLYTYGKQNLHDQATQVMLRGGLGASELNFELLRRFDQIVLTVTAVALVGGIGCLVLLFATSGSWRRRAVTRLEHRLEDLQASTASLQNQLAETRRAREELVTGQSKLEERVAQLSQQNTRLQDELDKRNRAEKALTQRRQELESSKNVLELHVQARTQELQLLQRRHEMILNSAGEGICGFDLEGKTTFVNPTVGKLTGWAVNELIGKSEQEIFPRGGNHAQAGLEHLAPGEQVCCRKDGTSFPVEFVKTPINEGTKEIGAVLIFKDITERKKAEETLGQRAAELARSNAELEQFAFVASHDLQEPLRKIQAFGDRVKVKCEGGQSAEVRDYLERMQSAAARMRTLINDLLTFSRVIRSSEPFVQVDLGAATREVLTDLEVLIEKKGGKVEVEALPTLQADPMQMRQLMLNLIGNALKFQPAGGTPHVRITARSVTTVAGDLHWELSVKDNGIGFEAKYLDRIFAVFQRLHGRGEYEGTGVGLAVCRRIVDRHHGTISAKSEPGKGATFIVTLPAGQAEGEARK
ncbi:MAG TPA: ATP-binding protein [Verrucomicrobiae bacterium]